MDRFFEHIFLSCIGCISHHCHSIFVKPQSIISQRAGSTSSPSTLLEGGKTRRVGSRERNSRTMPRENVCENPISEAYGYREVILPACAGEHPGSIACCDRSQKPVIRQRLLRILIKRYAVRELALRFGLREAQTGKRRYAVRTLQNKASIPWQPWLPGPSDLLSGSRSSTGAWGGIPPSVPAAAIAADAHRRHDRKRTRVGLTKYPHRQSRCSDLVGGVHVANPTEARRSQK